MQALGSFLLDLSLSVTYIIIYPQFNKLGNLITSNFNFLIQMDLNAQPCGEAMPSHRNLFSKVRACLYLDFSDSHQFNTMTFLSLAFSILSQNSYQSMNSSIFTVECGICLKTHAETSQAQTDLCCLKKIVPNLAKGKGQRTVTQVPECRLTSAMFPPGLLKQHKTHQPLILALFGLEV